MSGSAAGESHGCLGHIDRGIASQHAVKIEVKTCSDDVAPPIDTASVEIDDSKCRFLTSEVVEDSQRFGKDLARIKGHGGTVLVFAFICVHSRFPMVASCIAKNVKNREWTLMNANKIEFEIVCW